MLSFSAWSTSKITEHQMVNLLFGSSQDGCFDSRIMEGEGLYIDLKDRENAQRRVGK